MKSKITSHKEENIYMPAYVVKKPFYDQSNSLVYSLKENFWGITKSKLYKLLQPTENIFNTVTKITPFSPKEFEINEQLEVKNYIKKQFIQSRYFFL